MLCHRPYYLITYWDLEKKIINDITQVVRADVGYGLRGGIELEDAVTALSLMAGTSDT